MAAQVLTVEVDEYTAERLGRFADDRRVPVSELIAEALSLFIILEEQPGRAIEWAPEDLAAVREGIAQLDRGEGVGQDVVEREIDELLRS